MHSIPRKFNSHSQLSFFWFLQTIYRHFTHLSHPHFIRSFSSNVFQICFNYFFDSFGSRIHPYVINLLKIHPLFLPKKLFNTQPSYFRWLISPYTFSLNLMTYFASLSFPFPHDILFLYKFFPHSPILTNFLLLQSHLIRGITWRWHIKRFIGNLHCWGVFFSQPSLDGGYPQIYICFWHPSRLFQAKPKPCWVN